MNVRIDQKGGAYVICQTILNVNELAANLREAIKNNGVLVFPTQNGGNVIIPGERVSYITTYGEK